MDSKPWYNGKISQNETQRLLRMDGNDITGTFLICDSQTAPGHYTLSLYCFDSVKHYRIRSLCDELYFPSQKKRFGAMEELVAWH